MIFKSVFNSLTHSLLIPARETQSLSFRKVDWGEHRGYQTVGVGLRHYQKKFGIFFKKKNYRCPKRRQKSDTKNWGGGGIRPPDHRFPAEPLTMV